MLIDKHATLQCLGCIMKKPSLLEEYTLTQYDFEEEQFYAILFSCVYNLYNQGVEIIDTFAIDSFLSRYEKQYKISTIIKELIIVTMPFVWLNWKILVTTWNV